MAEVLSAPNHKDFILKALSNVPIATTKQIATLHTSTDPNFSLHNSSDPRKKASFLLRELEKERLVKSKFISREKVWSITRAGRKITNTSLMKFPIKIDHALSIVNLYFSLRPDHWLYEPKEKFLHENEHRTWAPDCIFTYQRKVYVCELQLTPLSQSRWADKWSHFNDYFNGGYFKTAAFQQWSNKTLMPNFLVITPQDPANVRNGFAVAGRELIVTRSF